MGNTCGGSHGRNSSKSIDLTGIVTDGSNNGPADTSRYPNHSSPLKSHRKTAPTNNNFIASGGTAAPSAFEGVMRVESVDKNEDQRGNLKSNVPSPRQLSFTKEGPLSNSNDSFDFNLTERQTRLQQILQCENECSEILDYLYIGGSTVATSWATIKANNITRIVNCAKSAVANCFEGKKHIEYLTLDMLDGRIEDITWHVFKVIHFIIDARKKKEKVLVHCEKGVSRSCSIVIAYYMWSTGKSWKDAFDFVKAKRIVCNPNTAFTCNLVEFGELITFDCKTCNLLFRLASHLHHDMDTAVLKICRNPSTRKLCVPTMDCLDSSGVFVLVPPMHHSGGSVNAYVWKGKYASEAAAKIAVEETRYLHGIISRVDEILLLREKDDDNDDDVAEGSLHVSLNTFKALLIVTEGANEVIIQYDDFYVVPPIAVALASMSGSGDTSDDSTRQSSSTAAFTAPKVLQPTLEKSPSTPRVPIINISPSPVQSAVDDLEPPPLQRGGDSAPISPSGITATSLKPQLYRLVSGNNDGFFVWEALGVYDFDDMIETEVLLLFCYDRTVHFLWLGSENNFYASIDGSIDIAEIQNLLLKRVSLGDVSKHVNSDDGKLLYSGITVEQSGRESDNFLDEFQRGQ